MRYKTALQMVKRFKNVTELDITELMELESMVARLNPDTRKESRSSIAVDLTTDRAIYPRLRWTGAYATPEEHVRGHIQNSLNAHLTEAVDDAVREVMVWGMVNRGLGRPQDASAALGQIVNLASVLYDRPANAEHKEIDFQVHVILKVPAREGADVFRASGASFQTATEKLYEKFMTGICWISQNACGQVSGFGEPEPPLTGPFLD